MRQADRQGCQGSRLRWEVTGAGAVSRHHENEQPRETGATKGTWDGRDTIFSGQWRLLTI